MKLARIYSKRVSQALKFCIEFDSLKITIPVTIRTAKRCCLRLLLGTLIDIIRMARSI